MAGRSISGSSFSMSNMFDFKGSRTEIRSKGIPCTSIKQSDIKEAVNAAPFVPLVLGAAPVCSGKTMLSSVTLCAMGAARVAGNIQISHNSDGFTFDYSISVLNVVNGASAKNGLLTEDELKKRIKLWSSHMVESTDSGFSCWRDVLMDAMQDATIQDFMKGKQSAVCAMIGDPVNVNTGNFIYEKEDLCIKGRIPLYVKRFYNRMDTRSGRLGKGWRHNYEIQLFLEPDRYVLLWEDGREEIYMKDEDLSLIPLFGGMERLKVDREGFLYIEPDGRTCQFDSDGRLLWRRDSNGQGILCTYDRKDRLYQVSNGKGAVITYHYDNFSDLLCEVTDHTGRSVKYFYELGRLKEVRDAEKGSCQYYYDSEKNISRIRNPRGVCALENSYDEKGRTIVQKFADGGAITYDYQEALSRTLVTEQNENRVAYVHDERYRNVANVYVDGEEHFCYNDQNQLTVKTDKCGNKTQFTYDGKGNICQILYPDGEIHNMTYDGNDRLLVFSVNGKVKEKNTYDDRGNLLKTVDALGRSREMSYDEDGNMVKVILTDGSSVSLEYNDGGNVTRILEDSGCQISYVYDACGRVISIIDGEGNRTSYAYDACSRLTSVTNAKGKRRRYEYSENGKLIRFTDYNGAVFTQSYNCMNKVECSSFPDGEQIRLEYDQMQNIVKKIYSNGAKTVYSYDDLNHLVQVLLPDGGTICYEYDQNGNQISQTDPEGNRTEFAYDECNRLKKIISPMGAATEYEYDMEGRLICIKNAAGQYHIYDYDEMGQLIRETDVSGKTVSYEYNNMGKVAAVVDAGKRRTEYEYYPGGRLSKVIYPDGNYEVFTYNKNGLLLRRQNHTGIYLEYSYDCLKRLISVSNSYGQKKSYTYDAVGNVTSVTDTLGNVTRYEYSLGGKLLSVIDAEGNRMEYACDIMGKLSAACQHEGTQSMLDMEGKIHLDHPYNEESADIYLQDEMGSTVRLLDIQKKNQVIYGYDEFRQDLYSTRGEMQPFGYIGYQKDSVAETYYMNNPVTFYDPAGLERYTVM